MADGTDQKPGSLTQFRILQRVSADINSTLDLDEICDVALRTMDELFEFHHANILLLEADGTTLRVIASRGYENQAIGGRVQVGTGVIGMVAKKRQMMHVNNLGHQRAYAAAQRREMENFCSPPRVPALAGALRRSLDERSVVLERRAHVLL